jgi:energy-coupling factor transporter ATP-binding protein EcfA2
MAAPVVCRGVAYTFPGRDVPALQPFDLELTAGSWALVAGLSGSGKSTLLQALAGLLKTGDGGERHGELLIDGRDPQRLPAAERAALVGMVLQSADQQICTTTVESEVAFGLENLALPVAEIDARIDEALRFVGLSALRARRVNELSGGQRQRLVLAAVLAMRPRVLLLDEPLSQLDPGAAAQLLAVLDRLRDGGPTVIVAEHRVAPWLERVDRVLVLEAGGVFRNETGASVRGVECLGDTSDGQASERLHSGPSPRHPAIVVAQLNDVCFGYDDQSPRVMDELQLAIHAGERVALLGANGSGKSTLLALLAGIYAPQRGTIQFADEERAPVGFIPQIPDGLLFCRTVREELAFAPRNAGCSREEIAARVADAARRFHLEKHLDRSPILLSQGERLRVALAATYTLHARLLLLDEPTTGQDSWHEKELMSALAESVARGGPPESIVFSTHDLAVAERYADRVIVLDAGRVVADDAPPTAIAAFRALLAREAAP